MSEFIDKEPKYTELPLDDRIHLRQVKPNEAEKMFEIIDSNREYLGKWLPFPAITKSPEDSRSFIRSVIQDRKDEKQYGFGVFIDGELAGHTSIMHVNDGLEPEIGYWLSEKFAGQGIATKSTIALTNFGFNTLNLPRIVIRADVDNIGSKKVAEKAGYQFVCDKYDEKIGHINIWEIINPRI
jgi:ribosomal-protein-serine acetyltransferase